MSEDKQLEHAWKVKFPFWFWGKLPFNFRYEIFLFHRLREWKDGISFFELIINLDRYDKMEYIKFKDNPTFNLHLIILNFTIFQIEICKRKND